MRVVAFALLLLALLTGRAASQPVENATPPLTLLCAITQDPGAFDAQEVAVRAFFASDYHHWYVLMDPACKDTGLPFRDAMARVAGKRDFERALCSEAGGLVVVTAVGQVESLPGQLPSVVLRIRRYAEPAAAHYDAAWASALLEDEARSSWREIRRHLCFRAGFIDPETSERREPAPDE